MCLGVIERIWGMVGTVGGTRGGWGTAASSSFGSVSEGISFKPKSGSESSGGCCWEVGITVGALGGGIEG